MIFQARNRGVALLATTDPGRDLLTAVDVATVEAGPPFAMPRR